MVVSMASTEEAAFLRRVVVPVQVRVALQTEVRKGLQAELRGEPGTMEQEVEAVVRSVGVA
jgi:hypothetical protein